MLFCTSLQNVIQIGPSSAEKMTSAQWHFIAQIAFTFYNLLCHFNGWEKTQLFNFCASRHQQARGILLAAKAPRFKAEAVKIVPRGCLETRQCLEAPHHCFQGAEVHGTGRHSLYSSYKL